MKNFEWRTRYAPNGYAYVKRRIDFHALDQIDSPVDFLDRVLEEMRHKLAKDCPYFFDPLLAQTRLSVFPKEVGESVNHLDPLKPRFGIELEIRQPMPADPVVPSADHSTCCGAPVYRDDDQILLCSDCFKACGTIKERDEFYAECRRKVTAAFDSIPELTRET